MKHIDLGTLFFSEGYVRWGSAGRGLRTLLRWRPRTKAERRDQDAQRTDDQPIDIRGRARYTLEPGPRYRMDETQLEDMRPHLARAGHELRWVQGTDTFRVIVDA